MLCGGSNALCRMGVILERFIIVDYIEIIYFDIITNLIEEKIGIGKENQTPD